MNLSYALFFISNFSLILTCLFLAGVRLYTLKEYTAKEADYYFPDSRLICFFLVTPVLQFPYLFHLGSESALLYVVLFDVLLFVPAAVLLWEKKFYHRRFSAGFVIRHTILPILLLIPLFIGALLDVKWPTPVFQGFIALSVMTFFVGLIQLYQCVVVRYNPQEVDLSRGFVLSTYVVLSIRMVFVVAEFALMDRWVKMICDAINAIFSFYTILQGTAILRPRLQPESDEDAPTPLIADPEPEIPSPDCRPSQRVQEPTDELTELGELIRNVIVQKELFRQSDLKLSTLCEYLPTNRTYVSAAINKIEPRGFYSFILSFRIAYACNLINTQPELKIEDVALQSGFSSQKIFSRLFRQETGMSPSVYRGIRISQSEKQSSGIAV